MVSSRWSAVLGLAAAAAAQAEVSLSAGADHATVAVGGEEFFTLSERQHGRPVVWPLRAAGGIAVTRSWPMAEQAEAEHDHPHQKSVWFAHGDVDGVDFWSEAKGAGRIEPVGRLRSSLDEHGCVRTSAQHRWVDAQGALVCTDERVLRAQVDGDARMLHFDVTLRALAERPLRLGDTKEGTMGLRLHPALRLEGKVATGRYLDSEGRTDRAVWGKRARWVACRGTIDAREVTVAMMDHPANLRHPTWWHARPYGLLAANPFGRHDFDGATKGSGDHEVAAGGQLRLCYAVWLVPGEADEARIEQAWRAFVAASADGR